jgi:hypothetical protein
MAINNGIRRRNIWKMYRLKLLFFGAVGMSFELAYAYSFLGMGGTADSHLKAFVCSFLAIAFIQLTISAAYVLQAYTYFRPLQLHLQHPRSNPPREHVEAIQRVIFYVRLSIFSMVVNFACFASFILNLYYMNHAAYICIMCCFAWSRITTSFSQMRAISPKPPMNFPSRGCLPKKLLVAISPAPWPAPRISTVSSLTGEVVNPSGDLAIVPIENPSQERAAEVE